MRARKETIKMNILTSSRVKTDHHENTSASLNSSTSVCNHFTLPSHFCYSGVCMGVETGPNNTEPEPKTYKCHHQKFVNPSVHTFCTIFLYLYLI